jgi:uncharacterized protein (DUF2141 family)
MIPIKRFIEGSILLGIALICLNQCKSPAAQQDTPVAVTVDSIAATDSAKTEAVPSVADTTQARAPLTLIVTNLASRTGPVIVGVYKSKNKFPDPNDQLKLYKFVPDSDILVATINDLSFDTYALAIYQDVNSNGKIDKNIIGIPTEPYAFSNNYRPTVKAPAFKNCCFEYSATKDTVRMKMIR